MDTGIAINGKTKEDRQAEIQSKLEAINSQRKALKDELSGIKAVKEPVQSLYKGHAILTIPQANGKPYTFGKSKAKAIIEHYKAIQQFAQ
jgi:hypothetical protein